MTLFLIDCVVLIACVMMQPAKNDNDAMSALTGGAGDLFSRRKARGFEVRWCGLLQQFVEHSSLFWH